jgi:hypothetical protein
MSVSAVRDAWFEAALDLRIRIQEPNPLGGVPDDPERIVYLPDFGSQRGTVIFAQDFAAAPLRHFDTASLRRAGYFCSTVSAIGQSKYHRRAFIEALLDWGYFGPEAGRPQWYAEETRKSQKSESEQAASPNGGPAERIDNSGATGGPPSVS